MKVSNPEKNKTRLLKERLYKRAYRKRMKDQPSPISDSTDEGFSQRPSHTRLFKKAEKSLPRSPRKRNAVVSNSAKKFQLRIQLIKQKNCCSILFYSILYYLNIHKVMEDNQSKILMQTKNLS